MFGKELKTQLYFRDDNSFIFIRREMMYSCLVEKAGDVLKRAWKHFYSCQLPFPGYKRIPAAVICLGFSRDIILDPFNMVPTGQDTSQKPDKSTMAKWIANIAENQRHIFRAKRELTLWTSRITWGLLGVLFIMVLVWAFAFLKGYYGS